MNKLNLISQLSVIVLMLCPIGLYAQVNAFEYMPTVDKPAKRWKVATVGLHIGGYNDNYGDMTYIDALRMVENTAPFSNIDLTGYTLAGYSVALTGTNIGTYIELHPFSKKRQDFHTGHRLRIGVSANLDRELVVDYTNYDRSGDYPTYYSSDYIGYCIVENEVNLNASYTVSYTLKRWSLYAGPGVNIGGTYDNFLMILSSNPQLEGVMEKSRNSVYTRLYATAGVSFLVGNRLNINLDFQKGGGVQLVNGASNRGFNSTSIQLGLKYRVMK